jgi:hypothetical protein
MLKLNHGKDPEFRCAQGFFDDALLAEDSDSAADSG